MAAERGRQFVSRYGTVLGLVIMCAYFATASPAFLEKQNIINILEASSILGILAAGLTIPLIVQDFDLSIAANATFAGLFSAGVAVDHGTVAGIFAGLAFGLGVGLVNAFIVTALGVSAFIATLAVATIIAGMIFDYTEFGQVSSGLPADFGALGQSSFLGIRSVVWVMVGVLIFTAILLRATPFGRRMYAVGENPTAARLAGISVVRTRVSGFVLCGILAALAGVVLASHLGFGSGTAGQSYLLPAFAACFIGAATFRDGEFHIPGTFVGILMLGVLANGLVLTGVSAAWNTMTQGIALIAAVSLSRVLRRHG